MSPCPIRASLLATLLFAAVATAPAAETTQPGRSRDVKDVDAVPFLTAEGRELYKKWSFRAYNRVFAINPKNGDWGVFPNEDDLSQMLQVGPGGDAVRRTLLHFAIQDALSRCQKQPGDKCFVYAQNGDVVWDGKNPAVTGVAQSPANREAAADASRRQESQARAEQEQRQNEVQAKAANESRQSELKPAADPERKTAGTASSAHRRALVFGNDNYKHVPALKNARADAKSMAQALTGLGYSVNVHFDLDERDMKKAIRDFARVIAGGDEILFYFAGHGVQISSENYLLPVDIRAEDVASVRDEAIPLQRILDGLAEAKARLALAIIDACRDNPFKGSGRAIGGRGLAPTSAATGQMIMFSAGAGQQALDKLGPNDDSPNGLFTRVFLKHVQKKGITVDRVMRDIRSEVVELAKSVGHEQVPALYDQVVGDYYFAQ